MKGYLVPLSVFAVILGFVLWNHAAVAERADFWQEQLEQCEVFAQSQRWSEAESLLEESFQDWRRHQTYLQSVCMHTIVDDAEAMYFRAAAFARTQELSEFCAELSQLRCQLQLLTDKERISLGNIL